MVGEGEGHNHVIAGIAKDDSRPALDPPDAPEDAADLERWSRFHELVAQLPAEAREVVGLVFYHGWTQGQVAELFQGYRTNRAALVDLRADANQRPNGRRA